MSIPKKNKTNAVSVRSTAISRDIDTVVFSQKGNALINVFRVQCGECGVRVRLLRNTTRLRHDAPGISCQRTRSLCVSSARLCSCARSRTVRVGGDGEHENYRPWSLCFWPASASRRRFRSLVVSIFFFSYTYVFIHFFSSRFSRRTIVSTDGLLCTVCERVARLVGPRQPWP